jgi:hypothetical protein
LREKDEGIKHQHSGAICKIIQPKKSFKRTNEAVQIHGGNGYVAGLCDDERVENPQIYEELQKFKEL